ncbi:glycosyltransferase family 2 protein, partial [Candidatus Woesearchaeota archaeon]|nr:glycosyltransferase family 2 protein [Candidatus Woesearchaeota archaeon]
MKLQISIVVIFDQFRGEKLERLLSSMKNQLSHYPCEIIFLQESDMPDPSLPPPSFSVPLRHVTIPAKKGIAFNRNQGIRQARGEIIVFIDDDCWVQENWLKSMVEPLLNDRLSNDKKVMAVTSGTKIPQSNFLGDCIAALGFPGGGSLGFEKVWKVDQQGFTNHLAVGNCALRRSIFDKVGWF